MREARSPLGLARSSFTRSTRFFRHILGLFVVCLLTLDSWLDTRRAVAGAAAAAAAAAEEEEDEEEEARMLQQSAYAMLPSKRLKDMWLRYQVSLMKLAPNLQTKCN